MGWHSFVGLWAYCICCVRCEGRLACRSHNCYKCKVSRKWYLQKKNTTCYIHTSKWNHKPKLMSYRTNLGISGWVTVFIKTWKRNEASKMTAKRRPRLFNNNFENLKATNVFTTLENHYFYLLHFLIFQSIRTNFLNAKVTLSVFFAFVLKLLNQLEWSLINEKVVFQMLQEKNSNGFLRSHIWMSYRVAGY